VVGEQYEDYAGLTEKDKDSLQEEGKLFASIPGHTARWQSRQHLGEVFHRLAAQKESRIEEGHLQPDHVHMLISIPPKYAVSQVVGFIKGKSAIYVARVYGDKKRNFVGQSFWARGFFVSTVGRDETVIRNTSRTRRRKTTAWSD
jgi:putative transposase